jgi:sulfatase maturation enzyme AslB (radical SAM superfamily)
MGDVIDKKRLLSKLPHLLQLPLAKAYCNRKKKWVQNLKTPVALIFFVTSRCNLRCSHCFYWQELNTGDAELSISEIRRIASSFKHPVSLSLTGGEPFIRRDLKEIIEAFHQGCGTREVAIATNGTLQESTVETIRSVLQADFLSSLSVQISLDGLEKTHDEIRDVKGSFQKSISTIGELKKIGRNYPGFQLKTALTVQKRNLSGLKEFVDNFLPLKIPLRFNIVRGGGFGVFDLPPVANSDFDPKGGGGSFLSLDEIKGAYALLKEMNDSSKFHFWPSRQQRIWKLSIRMLEERQSSIPCYASAMESVLYSDGDVAFCELSKPFENIREFDYDFSRLWKSENANKMRKLISRCYCIHGCNLTTGLTFEPEAVVSVLNERQKKVT